MGKIIQQSVKPLRITPPNFDDPKVTAWAKEFEQNVNNVLIKVLEENRQRIDIGLRDGTKDIDVKNVVARTALEADTINEYTSGSGVTIDGVNIKDSGIGAHNLDGKLTAGANEIEGSNFDINGGTIDGTPIGASSASTGKFTTIQATGAEALKIYTYTHTLTSGDTTSGYCDITISAITQTKIRSLVAVVYDISNTSARWDSIAAEYATKIYLTSTTNARVYLGGQCVANDIVSLTIIEVQ